MPPRLPPLPDDQWDDRTREVLAALLPRRMRNAEAAGNAMSTLVRHPDLTAAFLPYSTYLLVGSTLPDRLRELVVLRVARRRNCAYEWAHHVLAAQQCGLTEAEIEAAGQGKADDPLESTVLRAVDELEDGSDMSDDTWAALTEHLDERQLMDLVFTVGTYALMATAFNTFGIRPEHDARERAERRRARDH
ncbi:carboxymuconolactone decarboxylase family protein [Streptomyces sp. NPDC051985]|uniref:carboxymuconolactone decarboxylase family protein n=1 Tax=Streptomyces sp. NPDC051985 TaxID=3155807 RepID=UPI0034205448